MTKHLAIMTEPKFGMRDMGRPAFWFDVKFGEELQYGAFVILSVDEMAKIIKKHDIYDMGNLKNHTCQVESDGVGSIVSFVDIVK